MMKKHVAMRSWQYVLFALGVLVCLIGGFLMGWGEPILGENHTGIATVIGIVGIGIIGTFNTTLTLGKAKRRKA